MMVVAVAVVRPSHAVPHCFGKVRGTHETRGGGRVIVMCNHARIQMAKITHGHTNLLQ